MELRSVESIPKRINPSHDADLAFWARILDASPEELRRAVADAGSEITSVRTFLASRQLRFDFDAQAHAAAPWRA